VRRASDGELSGGRRLRGCGQVAAVTQIASLVTHLPIGKIGGIAFLVCVIVGLGLAIAALIARRGRSGILAHALVGLTINGGILFSFVVTLAVDLRSLGSPN